MNLEQVTTLLRLISLVTISLLASAISTQSVRSQASDGEKLNFEIKHRVTAHGNEFNGLAKSSDEQRLFVASEKGDIIVWNIASQRVERTLRQASPVHLIAALANPDELIASGSNHHKPANALVRKWNVLTGVSVDLPGLDTNSFPTALTTEKKAGVIALATADGSIHIWDAGTSRQIASWKLKDVPLALALLERQAYVATIDRDSMLSEQGSAESGIIKFDFDDPNQGPTEFLRIPGRSWVALNASPDGRFLSGTYESNREGARTVLLKADSKMEVGSFEGTASVWIDSAKLLLFNWLDPSAIAQVSDKGEAPSIRKLEQMESDERGRAFDLSGQVTSNDGSKVWASYRKGPGLLEFDLATNKIKALISGPSAVSAISGIARNEDDGELLTGGADGYVRLWNLADLSLIKEFQVGGPEYYVTAAHLLPGARQAVVGITRIGKEMRELSDKEVTEVFLLDLQTGQQKKMFDVWWRARIAVIQDRILYPEGARIKLITVDGKPDAREFRVGAPVIHSTVSLNGRWLAVLDAKKKLTVFDLTSARKKAISIKDHWGPSVITNDGRFVYAIANEGQLTRWDINNGRIKQTILTRIRDMHTRVDFMMLANNDKWLVTAGNHGDVGIFDRVTGELLLYTRSTAAAFFVEKVWIDGNRMIFTTDTGVMVEGTLK